MVQEIASEILHLRGGGGEARVKTQGLFLLRQARGGVEFKPRETYRGGHIRRCIMKLLCCSSLFSSSNTRKAAAQQAVPPSVISPLCSLAGLLFEYVFFLSPNGSYRGSRSPVGED